jgi:RHH-type transcriptional regulator, rel operon repressor / antitoxin RelB
MSMVAVRLDPEMEAELNKLATETGRSKSYYMKEALASFLEDRADYLLALAALERQEPRTSLADLRKELGLER